VTNYAPKAVILRFSRRISILDSASSLRFLQNDDVGSYENSLIYSWKFVLIRG